MPSIASWKFHPLSDRPRILNSRGVPWTRDSLGQRIGRLKKKLGLKGDVCAYLGLDVSSEGDVVAEEGGLGRFALVDPKGTRIRPKKVATSTGETLGMPWQWFDIGFPPSELVGDLESYRLAILLENGHEQIMGPIGDVQPRLVSAGVAKVSVNRVDIDRGKTNISFYGFQLPYRHARLDVGQDATLGASGWGQGGKEYPYYNSLEFPVGEVGTDPATWRLVLDAPTSSARHTLRVTLNDIQIGN